MTASSLAGPRLGMGQGVGLGLCPLSRPDAKEPLRTGGVPQRSHQEAPDERASPRDDPCRGMQSTQPGRKTVMGARILVVDDEPSILRVVAANLRARGYEALTAASGKDALTVIETQQPDCIVLDLGLPDVGGLEVLRPPPRLDDDAGRDPHRRRRRAPQGHGARPWRRRLRHQAVHHDRPAGQGPRGAAARPVPEPRRGREASRSARSVSTLMPGWSPGGGSRCG